MNKQFFHWATYFIAQAGVRGYRFNWFVDRRAIKKKKIVFFKHSREV